MLKQKKVKKIFLGVEKKQKNKKQSECPTLGPVSDIWSFTVFLT